LLNRISLLFLFLFQCTYGSASRTIDYVFESKSSETDLPSEKKSALDFTIIENEQEEMERFLFFPLDFDATFEHSFYTQHNVFNTFYCDYVQEMVLYCPVSFIIFIQNFRI